MEKKRRELTLSGMYIKMNDTKDIFKVRTFVVNDPVRLQYYILEDGTEIERNSCVSITIPNSEDMHNILQKYPDAMKYMCDVEFSRREDIENEVHRKIGEARQYSLIRELKYLRAECIEVEKALGIYVEK